MIQLLFALVFSEMVLILTLLFRTPLRNVVLMGLDMVKQGRGPVMAQTVAATLFVVFSSSLYSIVKIHKMDGAKLNPTDQVLLANHLLEASLMGFSLFLAVMVDRLHYYIKELQVLRKNLEVVKKQNQGYEDMKTRGLKDDSKASEEEIAAVRTEKKQPNPKPSEDEIAAVRTKNKQPNPNPRER